MEPGIIPGIHLGQMLSKGKVQAASMEPGIIPGIHSYQFYQGLTQAVKPIFDNLSQKHPLHCPSEERPQKNPFIQNSCSCDDSTVFLH